MNQVKLVSKKGSIVSAYLDTAIFYATKGNGVETEFNGSLKKVPYGIIDDIDANPFELEFDSETKKVYMNPGEAHIYGRQIRLTERTEIFDFHNTSESVKLYCTVFFNLDLDDFTQQRVSIAIDLTGAKFKDFSDSMVQDNVYELGHGIFQAPISIFNYTPATGTFSNYQRIMPILKAEERDFVANLPLDATINKSIKVSDRVTIENGKFKFNHASNQDALNRYIARGYKGTSDEDYSVCTGANSIGGTTITSDIANMWTTKRYELGSLGNMGGGSYSFKKELTIDKSHAQRLRFYTTGTFKAKIKYTFKGILTFGVETTKTLPENDNWIEAPCTEHQHGLDHFPYSIDRFHRSRSEDEWFSLPSVGNTLTLVYYYQTTLTWVTDSGVYYEYWKFGYCKESDYGSISGTDNGVNNNTMGSSTAKRKLAFIRIKTISNTKLEISIESNSAYNWDGWSGLIYEWSTLHQLSDFKDNTLKGYIDILYKGDVRL